MSRLITLWYSLRSSLWFVPTGLVLLAISAAVVLLELDLRYGAEILEDWPLVLRSGPDGARNILSAIATAMMTVAGVSYSVTIVTLSLASNQYSPRILRNFMRQRLNQVVLGVFVSVFTYCLLVLQAIRGQPNEFVPQLALAGAIGLALTSIGFLIAFIHHTAVTIQATEIVAEVARETLDALRAVLRHEEANTDEASSVEPPEPEEWRTIDAAKTGYVQVVGFDGLYKTACRRGVVVRLDRGVGDFVVAGRPLGAVAGAAGDERALAAEIQSHFGINSYRTAEQDPAYGVRQIVDIALKALSPGINDTTTAIHCVDYLGVVLHDVVCLPAARSRRFEGGRLRLIVRLPTPEYLVDIALHEIRQHSRDNVALILRLLGLIGDVLSRAKSPEVQRRLREHLRWVAAQAGRQIELPSDRAAIAQSVRRAREPAAASSSSD